MHETLKGGGVTSKKVTGGVNKAKLLAPENSLEAKTRPPPPGRNPKIISSLHKIQVWFKEKW